MIEPKDLSVKELKSFRKQQVELKNNANDILVSGRCSIVIRMIDGELESRGYDTKKLFKN
jgi:hypothetical protein